MKLFLAAYFSNPGLDAAWETQQAKITEAMAADPFGAKDIAFGALHQIAPADLELPPDAANLPQVAHSMVKLFHNMRAALHVPDQPPEKVPPASGPGRNDAFGLLSASLLNRPQPYAPIKFGLVWDIDKRLQEDGARPILYHNRFATCRQPSLKGLTIMVNSLFNGWRMEDVWLDR